MFDVEKLKKESALPPDDLARLEAQLREEFPGDEMMLELHLLRVLIAIKEGWITIDEALAETVNP